MAAGEIDKGPSGEAAGGEKVLLLLVMQVRCRLGHTGS